MSIPLASSALRDSLKNKESNTRMVASTAINDAIKFGLCNTLINIDKDRRGDLALYLTEFGYKVIEYNTYLDVSWD